MTPHSEQNWNVKPDSGRMSYFLFSFVHSDRPKGNVHSELTGSNVTLECDFDTGGPVELGIFKSQFAKSGK